LDEIDEDGEPINDDNFLLFLNSAAEKQTFNLPAFGDDGNGWEVVVDTAVDEPETRRTDGEQFSVDGRSLVLLRQAANGQGRASTGTLG
jgi:hypothetical protein